MHMKPIITDSGASDTMFVSKDDFVTYKPLPPHSGDSAKAVDGGFEIIGEGTVVKHYLVDGKEKKLTYTCAIHTPTLNANLISVSAFDKAGLTVTFGGGKENLVDRLVVSRNDLRGKCEDCIIGRQTRRPYDGKSEENLDPLELVSFNLWGPS